METKSPQVMVQNLVAQVISDIRIKFRVIPGMTPTRAIKMSDAVGSLLLDHISHVVDVREITDENGNLKSNYDVFDDPQFKADVIASEFYSTFPAELVVGSDDTINESDRHFFLELVDKKEDDYDSDPQDISTDDNEDKDRRRGLYGPEYDGELF